MVVKVLLLYSNGNMLAQKFKLLSDKLCVLQLVSNRDHFKFKNKIVVLCLSKSSIV